MSDEDTKTPLLPPPTSKADSVSARLRRSLRNELQWAERKEAPFLLAPVWLQEKRPELEVIEGNGYDGLVPFETLKLTPFEEAQVQVVKQELEAEWRARFDRKK